MKSKIKRQDFLRALMYLMALPLLWILNRMLKDHLRYGIGKKEIRINKKLPQGFTIYDEVIVYKKNNELRVYSSKCTHLGCKINKVEGEELVCPCHGSRYSSSGKPVKGPSIKGLTKLQYSIEDNEIIIEL